MSLNNTRNGPSKKVLSYGPHQTTNQFNMPSTSVVTPYQPRTPMVYSYSPNMPRNQLTESEPLSPYSEMQIPMSPIHQMNPMNSGYFRSQEAILQPQLNPYPKMAINKYQNSHSTRMVEARSQTMGSHDVRASPHARSSISPQTQPSFLHPPNLRTPSCNTDHSFMRSTSSSSADWNVPQNTKKSDGAGFTKMISDQVKTASQTAKLTSMNRKRILIGSIDQIINWNKLAKKADLYVIYEVTGVLESISYNSKAKAYKMIIRDNQKTSSILQAVFFPIDRDIPDVRTGALITFVGRMIGARKLQVLNMWPTNANSLAGLKRISFLCQRTLQEACLSAPEP